MPRVLAALLLLVPGLAWAHDPLGNPTTARPQNPTGTCEPADDGYEFTWTDYDMAAVTSTRISWYFTARNPPAYYPGQRPAGLNGEAIAEHIEESDTANRLLWDTSGVPAGSYWLWSLADDPPFQMIAFSRGIVVVAHDGDPVWPTVLFTDPDGVRDVADESFTVRATTCDPGGDGRVRLEATSRADGEGLETIAIDLPAADPTFTWDTSELCPGYRYLRATISDGRGLSFSAFAPYEIAITHKVGWDADAHGCGSGGAGGDAGGGGGGGGEGGSVGSPPRHEHRRDEGCQAGGGASLVGLLAAAAALGWKNRR